jgi:HAE1 family hydrophobic/amphiphilic exporter-1
MEATLEGAKLRFRPIVMTSLAFGFGVLPLAMTTGAGAGAQNAIGTSVLGGMVTATVLVVVFAPLFYVLTEMLFGRQHRQQTRAGKSGNNFFAGLKNKLFSRRPK